MSTGPNQPALQVMKLRCDQCLLEVAFPGDRAVCGHSRNFVQVHEELQGCAVGSAIFDVGHLHRDP